MLPSGHADRPQYNRLYIVRHIVIDINAITKYSVSSKTTIGRCHQKPQQEKESVLSTTPHPTAN